MILADASFDAVVVLLPEVAKLLNLPFISGIYLGIAVYRLWRIKFNNARFKAQQKTNDDQWIEIRLLRSQVDTLQIIIKSLLTSKQLHMWEKFGLTEEEWLQLDEATRQKMLVQEWGTAETPGGTTVLVLGEVESPQSMGEYMAERGQL